MKSKRCHNNLPKPLSSFISAIFLYQKSGKLTDIAEDGFDSAVKLLSTCQGIKLYVPIIE